MCIALPADLDECAGVYCLMQGQLANGQPVWANESRTRFLYQCPVGRWHVAGDDVQEDGFAGSFGWLSQSAYSRGRPPYDMESPWQRWNGSSHVDDPAVIVVPVAS